MRPEVIVTLGNFATRFITGLQIGITKARGQLFDYQGATVVPTFHPAAALRGGRFGGMSPVDAIRADLATVRRILDEKRARGIASGEAETGVPSEQLGLF
jgi:uracil-DNA glycosylase family 4